MTASVGDSPPRMPAFGSVAPLLPKVAQTRAGIIVSLLAATGLAVTAANDPRAQRLIGLSFAGGDNVKAKEEERAEAIAKLIADTGVDEPAPAVEGKDAVARNALLPTSKLPVEAARPFYMPKVSAIQETNAEHCLTQAIYYEAATESDSGKAAVAQVILNRLRHPAFPRTVCGVVYQGSSRPGCQFSFTCDGSIRRAPVPALWRRAAEIARAALAGHVEADVGMATHYHANYVLPRWAPKLTKIEQLGTHIFYRWPGGWGKRAAFITPYGGTEWIPSLDTLYRGSAAASAVVSASADGTTTALRRDPTDRRADNDVGGRVDPTKGWTPSLPDLSQTESRFEAMASQQAMPSPVASSSGD